MRRIHHRVRPVRHRSSMSALILLTVVGLVATFFDAGCRQSAQDGNAQAGGHDLAGTWRAKIQFSSGAFAGVKDLEFMYVFNAGGTMTESSNYDAYPPVPPAYGVWRRTGANQFEAHYEFYTTRMPEAKDSATSGAGWLPSGRGVLTEKITLSDDGKAFTSQVQLELFDQAGKAVEGGGSGTGVGERMTF